MQAGDRTGDQGSRSMTTIGRARTTGQVLPLGADDPVIAARAVRRALADAGRRAADVELLVVAAGEPIAQETLVRFARRALGPHGASVRVARVASAEADATALAARAAGVAVRRGPWTGVAVAVGLGPDGTTEARCLSAGLPTRAAQPPERSCRSV